MARARPIVLVHGGAGTWPLERRKKGLAGVEEAARKGLETLTVDHGNPVDAVVESIVVMEDNPIFNAGKGSTLNLAGRVENDASVMEGSNLQAGGVGSISGVKNPIRLARIVMERTDHALLVGKPAEKMARAFGLSSANLASAERRSAWKEGRNRLEKTMKLPFLTRNSRLYRSGMLAQLLDTVGALALDSKGNLAAGASTGGLSMKLPGRVGDSAIVAAGVYANNDYGAATATGIGEYAMRTAISKSTCDLMDGSSASTAAIKAIRSSKRQIGPGLGVIALDRRGRRGIAHSTRDLCWASASTESVETFMHGVRV